MTAYTTLAQAVQRVPNELSTAAVPSFVKSSYVLGTCSFHGTASQTGGYAHNYVYTQVTTNPSAGFRPLNADVTSVNAETQQVTATLKALTKNFDVDRLVQNAGSGDEVKFQVAQAIAGVSAAWNDAFINGSVSGDAASFDGLDVLLAGGANDIDGSSVDLSATTVAEAITVISALEDVIASVNGSDGLAILVNRAVKIKLAAVARLAGYATGEGSDAFGNPVATFAGIPLVDLGGKSGSNDPVIATTTGASDIYVARFAMDAVHAVSAANAPVINVILPNSQSGAAVNTGSVELYSAIALRSTAGAAVLRGVTV